MLTPRKFKKGDVVRLNSGDKQMTVIQYVDEESLPVINVLLSKEESSHIRHEQRVFCEWLNEGKKESGSFDEDSLELVSGDSVY